MKIGIHCPFAEIGGAMYSAAVWAEFLSRQHQVSIIHHAPNLNKEIIAKSSGINLGPIQLTYVPCFRTADNGYLSLWRRHRKEHAWEVALSKPYDLYITITHSLPPFCHAPRGVLIVLFPMSSPPRWPTSEGGKAVRRLPVGIIRYFYHRVRWDRRLASYSLKIANSDFTKQWSQSKWGVECEVLYSPSESSFQTCEKASLILSVGRFATVGHRKKQEVLLGAFGKMKDAGLRGWEYYCVGGLSDSPQNHRFFEQVRREGAEFEVKVLANLDRSRLNNLYERAKIFWLATGYGEDGRLHPELMEHFGKSTIEAMAAGCVPVVINRGGQPEIVEHGVSGFLWDTLEEMGVYTRLLMTDDKLRLRMSKAARHRASVFGREAHLDNFIKLLDPLLQH